jgi:hypothetical protein
VNISDAKLRQQNNALRRWKGDCKMYSQTEPYQADWKYLYIQKTYKHMDGTKTISNILITKQWKNNFVGRS